MSKDELIATIEKAFGVTSHDQYPRFLEYIGMSLARCADVLEAERVKVTPDYDLLLRQSFDTAEDAMRTARDRVNKLFGNGTAEAKPELVVAFMNYAAQDFATMVRSGVRS